MNEPDVWNPDLGIDPDYIIVHKETIELKGRYIYMEIYNFY